MKYSVILAVLAMMMVSAAQAQSTKQAPLCTGYQCPKVPQVKQGYITKDGKRYGNCNNHHHRQHKHCKEPIKTPSQQSNNTKR